MPTSSVRMINETAEVGGIAVWADTSIHELVNVTQPAMAIARGTCIDGQPLLAKRSQTCNEGVTCPYRKERQDPHSGSPDQPTTSGVATPDDSGCRRCRRVWAGEARGIRRRPARA